MGETTLHLQTQVEVKVEGGDDVEPIGHSLRSTYPTRYHHKSHSIRLEGSTDEVKGEAYNIISPRQATDAYTKETKMVALYAGTKYSSSEVKIALET